ncbi:MAG: TolC family protein [Bacteroidales bacterium]
MNKKNIFFTFLISCIILPLQGIGQTNKEKESTPIAFQLEDIIKLAKDKSPDAKIAKHRFLINYWNYRSFKAQFLPYLEANATLPAYQNIITNVIQEDGSLASRSINTFVNQAGLSLKQRIGFTNGVLGINTNLQRTENLNFTKNGKVQFISKPIYLSYNQNILGYNTLRWAKKIEPLKYEESRRKYLEEMEEVNARAVSLFFQHLQDQISIEIAEKNIRNYDTLYKIAKGRYKLGKIAENELLELELNLMNARLNKEQAYISYGNSLFQLKSFLRIKDDKNIVLIAPTPKPEEIIEIPLAKALIESKANSSTTLTYQKEMLEAESNLARNRYSRYNINLNATYGLTAEGLDIANSYKNFEENQNITLQLNIPILNWGEYKGKIKMAQSNLDLVKTSVDQKEVDYEQSIYLAVQEFNIQKNQLAIAAKSDTIAQLRYDITKKRYLIGKVNDVNDLNRAQVDSDQSRKTYYESLYTYWKNYYRIRKITLYDFEQDRQIYVNLNDLY